MLIVKSNNVNQREGGGGCYSLSLTGPQVDRRKVCDWTKIEKKTSCTKRDISFMCACRASIDSIA